MALTAHRDLLSPGQWLFHESGLQYNIPDTYAPHHLHHEPVLSANLQRGMSFCQVK